MEGTGNANVWFGCCFRDFVTFSTFDWGGGKKKEEKETKQIVCMWHISSSLVKFSRPSLHQSVPPTRPPPRPAAPPPSSSRKHTRGGVSRRGWSGGRGAELWGGGEWRGSHSGGIFGVSWHLGERFQLVRDPRVHFDGFAGE